MKLLPTYPIQRPKMKFRKPNHHTLVDLRPSPSIIGRHHRPRTRQLHHPPIRIPDLRGRIRMPKKARHDLIIPVAVVVVGTFGVRPAQRTRGLETLAHDLGARDAEGALWGGFVVPGRAFLEYEAFCGMVFWGGEDGLRLARCKHGAIR